MSKDLQVQQQQQQRQQQSRTKQGRKGQPRSTTQQHVNNGSQSRESCGSPAAQTSQGADVVLYYYTGWSQAKLHCSVNAGAWQDTDFQQVWPGGRSPMLPSSYKQFSHLQADVPVRFAGQLFKWQMVCSTCAVEWHPDTAKV